MKNILFLALLILTITYGFKTAAAEEAGPKLPQEELDKAEELHSEGVKLTEAGKHQEAIQNFDKALQINKDNVDYLISKCESLIELKRGNECAKSVKKSAEKNLATVKSLKKLTDTLETHEKKLNEMNNTLDKASVNQQAKIVMALEKLDPKLKDYYKVFYWTLTNYIDAYRLATTDAFNANTASQGAPKAQQDTSTFGKVKNGVNKINNGLSHVATAAGFVEDHTKGSKTLGFLGKAASFIGKLIPGVKHVVETVESVINTISKKRLEQSFQNKKNALDKIVKCKIDRISELALNLEKASVEVTQHRERLILNPKVRRTAKVGQFIAKAKNLIDNVKKAITGTEVSSFEELKAESSDLALTDVSLVLAYLYQHSDEICKEKASLDAVLTKAIGIENEIPLSNIRHIKKGRPRGGAISAVRGNSPRKSKVRRGQKVNSPTTAGPNVDTPNTNANGGAVELTSTMGNPKAKK